MAVKFHESFITIDETFRCYPDKVCELLQIFHGTDGYESVIWDHIHSNIFIKENMDVYCKKQKVQPRHHPSIKHSFIQYENESCTQTTSLKNTQLHIINDDTSSDDDVDDDNDFFVSSDDDDDDDIQ